MSAELQVSNMKRVFLALVVGIFAGCSGGGGGGGDGGSAICSPIGGGGATSTASVSATCFGCEVSNKELAIDRNFGSAADITTTAVGNVTLRGTAQGGVVFPAGSGAGAVFNDPGFDNNSVIEISVSTFLQGSLQESGQIYGTICRNCFRSTNNPEYAFLTTTKDFDAIELQMSSPGDSEAFPVFEICAK